MDRPDAIDYSSFAALGDSDTEQIQNMYRELLSIARRERQRLPSATLNTTALVHEAWLRMEPGDDEFEGRRHFLGTAAIVMRRLLVDYARRRDSKKRGGDFQHVELGDPGDRELVSLDRILDIDQALNQVDRIDSTLRHLVELRFFAGLSCQELAEATGRSERSVARDWARARALLKFAMDEAGPA